MSDIWTSGRRKAVYHRIGSHPNGQPRLRRAQYDFLKWDSTGDGPEEQYVVVPSSDAILSAQVSAARLDHEVGVLFGFYEPGYDVFDASSPGTDETWQGLHSFGFY